MLWLPVEGSAQTTQFVRGDANADSRINITDAVLILGYLLTGGVEPACLDAADFNDDAGTALNMTDAILVLTYLFTGGASPAAPAPSGPVYSINDSGVDPTGNSLGCARFAPCLPLPGSDVPPPPAWTRTPIGQRNEVEAATGEARSFLLLLEVPLEPELVRRSW